MAKGVMLIGTGISIGTTLATLVEMATDAFDSIQKPLVMSSINH